MTDRRLKQAVKDHLRRAADADRPGIFWEPAVAADVFALLHALQGERERHKHDREAGHLLAMAFGERARSAPDGKGIRDNGVVEIQLYDYVRLRGGVRLIPGYLLLEVQEFGKRMDKVNDLERKGVTKEQLIAAVRERLEQTLQSKNGGLVLSAAAVEEAQCLAAFEDFDLEAARLTGLFCWIRADYLPDGEVRMANLREAYHLFGIVYMVNPEDVPEPIRNAIAASGGARRHLRRPDSALI